MKRKPVKKKIAKAKRMPPPATRKRRKIKVLFVCELGEQKSVNRMLSFANRLQKSRLRGLFELNTAGVSKLNPNVVILILF